MPRNIYAEYRDAIVNSLRKRDGDWCQICADVIDFPNVEIDHRIAVADGGMNSLDNYRLVHPLCNRPGRRRQEIEETKLYLAPFVCVECGRDAMPPRQRFCSDKCSNRWRVKAFRLRKRLKGQVVLLTVH